MTERDLMAETSYAKAAAERLKPLPENFRFYAAEWLGDKPQDWHVMKVTGAVFRAAKSGPNKGRLSIMIPGTVQTTYVTTEEMARYK